MKDLLAVNSDFFQSKTVKKTTQTKEKQTQKPHKATGDRYLDAYLKKAQDILEKASLPQFQDELIKLRNETGNTLFSVAFVGEFSRGKSTLVNKLLNRNVLPSDVKPTTALITKIGYNPKDTLIHILPNKKFKTFELKQKSWDGLIADNDFSPIGTAYVGVQDDWLKNNKIILVDTPGTNDIITERSALADTELVKADAAVITTSALMPLSKTEMDFIKERVIVRNIPKIMIAVTMMDKVEREDRESVLLHIRKTLTEAGYNNLPIISTSLLENSTFDSGCEKIKEILTTWSDDENLTLQRRKRIVLQINDILNNATALLKEKIDIINAKNKEDAQRIIQLKKDELSQTILAWNSLNDDFINREVVVSDYINKLVVEKTELIQEQIVFELEKTNNPKYWFEKDFPHSLKFKMLPLISAVENHLSTQYVSDSNWLKGQIIKGYKSQIVYSTYIPDEGSSTLVDISNESNFDTNLEDTSKKRSKARIAVSAVQIVGCVVATALTGGLGFIGSICASTAGSIFSERYIEKSLNEQKDKVKAIVVPQISNISNKMILAANQKAKMMYKDVVKSSTESQESWVASMNNIFNSENLKNESTKQLTETIEAINLSMKSIMKGI